MINTILQGSLIVYLFTWWIVQWWHQEKKKEGTLKSYYRFDLLLHFLSNKWHSSTQPTGALSWSRPLHIKNPSFQIPKQKSKNPDTRRARFIPFHNFRSETRQCKTLPRSHKPSSTNPSVHGYRLLFMALLACPPRIHLLPSSSFSFRSSSNRRRFSLPEARSAAPNGLSVSASDRREANDVALVWFKHDLRIDDHPGLVAASRYRTVVPVYVFDHRILSRNTRKPLSLSLSISRYVCICFLFVSCNVEWSESNFSILVFVLISLAFGTN